MKRVLVFIIVAAVVFPLMVGGLVWFTYQSLGEESIPAESVSVLEATVAPSGYEWNSPVFGGMLYKEFYKNPSREPEPVGTLHENTLPINVPAGYTSTASLRHNDADVWSGAAAELENYIFLDNGLYELEVECRTEPETGRGYGSFIYRVSFDVEVDIRIEQSAEEIEQGEILAIQLFNLPEGMVPEARANPDLSPVVFVPSGPGRQIAIIAASHDSQPGSYQVLVRLGEESWTIEYTVLQRNFPEQHMTIDLSGETVSEANSPAAYAEYREVIPPLFNEWDDEQWWKGPFTLPTKGELSTQYGLFRYTNGSSDASRHPALDISARQGTPVVAPAGGRVQLARELLNTGNTVVIEHGAGLKSLFYHMNELTVAEGDELEQGEEIGAVGSTGYSTGPHLHYEVRLFGMSVDPMPLFGGTSGLYAFEEADEDEADAAPASEEEDGAGLPEMKDGLPAGLTWPRGGQPEDEAPDEGE